MKNLFYGGYIAADSSPIDMVTQTKDLGIIMSNNACFDEQVEAVITKGKRMSGWILRTFKTRAKLPMTTLFKSLVLPVMEYCCVAWSPDALEQVRKLESVQRYFQGRREDLADGGGHLQNLPSRFFFQIYRLKIAPEVRKCCFFSKFLIFG